MEGSPDIENRKSEHWSLGSPEHLIASPHSPFLPLSFCISPWNVVRSPSYHVTAKGLSFHLIPALPSSWENNSFLFIYGQNSTGWTFFSFYLFSTYVQFLCPFPWQKQFHFLFGTTHPSLHSLNGLSSMGPAPHDSLVDMWPNQASRMFFSHIPFGSLPYISRSIFKYHSSEKP